MPAARAALWGLRDVVHRGDARVALLLSAYFINRPLSHGSPRVAR
ncbi:hypothetical protein [Achromobacter kerstersii]|jgi:hypothetical protein